MTPENLSIVKWPEGNTIYVLLKTRLIAFFALFESLYQLFIFY